MPEPDRAQRDALSLSWAGSCFFRCRLAGRALAFLGCAGAVGAGRADPFVAGGAPAGSEHAACLEHGRDALVYRERLDRAGRRRGLGFPLRSPALSIAAITPTKRTSLILVMDASLVWAGKLSRRRRPISGIGDKARGGGVQRYRLGLGRLVGLAGNGHSPRPLAIAESGRVGRRSGRTISGYRSGQASSVAGSNDPWRSLPARVATPASEALSTWQSPWAIWFLRTTLLNIWPHEPNSRA